MMPATRTATARLRLRPATLMAVRWSVPRPARPHVRGPWMPGAARRRGGGLVARPPSAGGDPAPRSARRRVRGSWNRSSTYGVRQIAVAGAHHDGAMATTIVDRHAALAHARQRSVAAVLHVPGRPAHGGHAVAAAGAELALAVAAPQAARRLALLLLAHHGRARRTARAAGEGAAQDELGQSAGALGLAHLEEPAVEDGRLGRAAGQGGVQGDAALARVEDRAHPQRGGVGE